VEGHADRNGEIRRQLDLWAREREAILSFRGERPKLGQGEFPDRSRLPVVLREKRLCLRQGDDPCGDARRKAAMLSALRAVDPTSA